MPSPASVPSLSAAVFSLARVRPTPTMRIRNGDEDAAQFDRWLANERAEAYDEGYAANGQPTLVGELPIEYDHDNPYREET